MRNNNKKNTPNSHYNKYNTYHLNWMSNNKTYHDVQKKNFEINKAEDIKNFPNNKFFSPKPPQSSINITPNDNQRWIIIDASSIIFRYFYANNEITNSKNQCINAINGFCRIVLSFVHSPILRGKVIVVFDGAKKNFKKNFDGAYKGKRKPLPDGLKEQLLLAEEFCMYAKIFFDKHILYEADDLIASYATQLPGEIYIVAYDKDFFQLVNDRIFLWDYRKHIKIDRQWVFEKYGIYPDQMVDFWCLVGDMSDNLNGVTGIGKKRASQLLLKYNNLENIIQNNLNSQYDFQTAINLKKIIQLKTDISIKNFYGQDYVDFIKMNEFLTNLEIGNLIYK